MFKTEFTTEELGKLIAEDTKFQLETYGYHMTSDENGVMECKNQDDYYMAITAGIVASFFNISSDADSGE